MADGGPSVMTAGTAEMLKSSVDNWDTLVNMFVLASSFSISANFRQQQLWNSGAGKKGKVRTRKRLYHSGRG